MYKIGIRYSLCWFAVDKFIFVCTGCALFANNHIPEAKQTDRWKGQNTESTLQNLPVCLVNGRKVQKSILNAFEVKKKKKPGFLGKTKKPKKPQKYQIDESTRENERMQNNPGRQGVLISSCLVAEETKHLSVKWTHWQHMRAWRNYFRAMPRHADI